MSKKIVRIVLFSLAFLVVFLSVWTWIDYRRAAEKTETEYVDIAPLLEKETLSESDFELLFLQTGLGPGAVLDLQKEPDYKEQMKAFQTQQLSPLAYEQSFIFFPTTTAEQLKAGEGTRRLKLPPVKAGDILISRSTKTMVYRHGHAGLVLDENGRTLESLMIGSDSAILSSDIWLSYPTLMILRPKNLDEKTIEDVVRFGQEKMLRVPYHLLTGFLQKDKSEKETVDGTQCAHLVWQCYKQAGIDLDADGGPLVTPRDLARSEELDIVFSFGFGTDGKW